MSTRNPLPVISLYTGAGGLDLGLEAAGFDVTLAVEKDDISCNSIYSNEGYFRRLSKDRVINSDIHDVLSEECEYPSRQIADTASVDEGEPALLSAGPPCPPFSKSAYWKTGDTDRLQDDRADTLRAFLQVMRDTLPRAYVLENVPGITYKNKREALNYIEKEIDDINHDKGVSYSFEWDVINSAKFGVPQTRKRAFIVGCRDGSTFSFDDIKRTHVKPSKDSPAKEPYVTAWEAIGDVQSEKIDSDLSPGGKWADLLPSIPEGENYLWHTERKGGEPLFGWRTRYWSFLLKLSKRRPSWTIKANPGGATGPFHWENRRFTRRELCRLQTFPDDFRISGSLTQARRQLGNAVPPLLAERIGKSIRRQLFGHESVPCNYRFSFEKRCEEIPEPEPTSDIPSKYLDKVGDHDPHPGEGEGPLYNSD